MEILSFCPLSSRSLIRMLQDMNKKIALKAFPKTRSSTVTVFRSEFLEPMCDSEQSHYEIFTPMDLTVWRCFTVQPKIITTNETETTCGCRTNAQTNTGLRCQTRPQSHFQTRNRKVICFFHRKLRTTAASVLPAVDFPSLEVE